MGIELYGTDIHGTIIVTTGGNTYSVKTEKSTHSQPKEVSNTAEPPKSVETIKPAVEAPKGTFNINTVTGRAYADNPYWGSKG